MSKKKADRPPRKPRRSLTDQLYEITDRMDELDHELKKLSEKHKVLADDLSFWFDRWEQRHGSKQ